MIRIWLTGIIILSAALNTNAQQLVKLSRLSNSIETAPYLITEVTYAQDPHLPIGVKTKGINRTARKLYLPEVESDIESLFTNPVQGDSIILKIGHLKSADVPSAPTYVAFTSMHLAFVRRRNDSSLVLFECAVSQVRSSANSSDRHELNIRKCLEEGFKLFRGETTNAAQIVSESWLYRPPEKPSHVSYPIQQRNYLPDGAIHSHQDLLNGTVDTSFDPTLKPFPAFPTDYWLGSALPRSKWPAYMVHSNRLFMMVGNRYTRLREEDGHLIAYIVPPADPGPQGAPVGISFSAIGYRSIRQAAPYSAKPLRYLLDLHTAELLSQPVLDREHEHVSVYIVHNSRSTSPLQLRIDGGDTINVAPGKHVLAEISADRSNTCIQFIQNGTVLKSLTLQLAGSVHEMVEARIDKKGLMRVTHLDTQRKLQMMERLSTDNRISFDL